MSALSPEADMLIFGIDAVPGQRHYNIARPAGQSVNDFAFPFLLVQFLLILGTEFFDQLSGPALPSCDLPRPGRPRRLGSAP